MDSERCLWVLIGSHASSWVLFAFIWILIGTFGSSLVLIRPYEILWVLMCFYVSL